MTTSQTDQTESFDTFYKSFSYGSRSDLSFKFLAHFSETEASEFFKEFLKESVNALDDNKLEIIEQLVLKWQFKAYDNPDKFTYESGPFTVLQNPLSKSTIGLLSSSGHFVKGHDPKPLGVENMTQEQAEQSIMEFIKAKPELTEIPTNTSTEDLQVRHGGYDIRSARKDPNTVFPYQRLNELAAQGQIGKAAAIAYSFVGACSQMRLNKEAIPEWLESIKAQNLDGMVLTPV
ncbi:MAG: hypothetical protein MJE63_11850 [Proteobacteria bacterium]|nr:hypothetical protein [Pseudomonadota bacterium]